MEVDVKALATWSSSGSVAAEVALCFSAQDEIATEIAVDAIEANICARGIHVLRRHLTAELRALENLGFGRLVIGRKNHKSRFLAPAGIQRIGLAALGEPISAVDRDDRNIVHHRIALRPDFELTIPLPRDFSAAEAERLINFIRVLPFD